METPSRRKQFFRDRALRLQLNTPGDLTALTLAQASALIHSKKASPVDLTDACLAKVERDNPKINAWITVMRDQALARAKELSREQTKGQFRGPLHGIPIGLKDNIDSAGTRTTAGSKTLEGNVPTEEAFVTGRLLDAAPFWWASATCTSLPRVRRRQSVTLARYGTPGISSSSRVVHRAVQPQP